MLLKPCSVTSSPSFLLLPPVHRLKVRLYELNSLTEFRAGERVPPDGSGRYAFAEKA